MFFKKKIKAKSDGFFADFKKFINRGNVVDLAIAVVVGGAFGKIITSLVNDIIMPLLSLALGGMNFTDLKWVISPTEYDETGLNIVKNETALRYGSFIQTALEFFVIAFSIFIAYKIFIRARREIRKIRGASIAAVPPKPTTEALLTEIRDLLKAERNNNNPPEASDNPQQVS